MKYLKMLGLAAAAAAALMAFAGAGSASAATSTLCSAATASGVACPLASAWPINQELDLSLKSGTSAKLTDTSNNTLDTCSGAGTTVRGTYAEDSRNGVLAQGPVGALVWETCTVPTTTVQRGGISVEGLAGGNGTVRATGEFRVTINLAVFGKCIYGVTAGTDLGELKEGKPATFVANAVASKFTTPEDECPLGPASAKWTAEYTLTTPANTTLFVSNK